MANQRFSKKILNVCIIGIIIVAIIFTAIMFVLDYDEKGETNMPFKVSKISMVSTVNGQDVENSDKKWDISVIQNNDIYVYIEKNDEYKKQETIKSVKLENFVVKDKPKIGEIKIIEIGARMGGDCIGSDLVQISTGYDFLKMVIDVALGNKPDFTKVTEPKKAVIKFIFSNEDVEELEKIKKEHPEYIYYISPIDKINSHDIIDSSTRYGYYILAI